MLGVWWKPANRYGATIACLVSGLTYIVVAPYFFPSIVVGGGLEAKVGMTGSLLCVPLCFFLLTTVSMITNKIPALMNRFDHQKDHVLIDKIHGWSDSSEERYNSNTAGIIVAAVSLFFCIYAVLPGGW